MPKNIEVPKPKWVTDPVMLIEMAKDENISAERLAAIGGLIRDWSLSELNAALAHDKQVETAATYENHKTVTEGQ